MPGLTTMLRWALRVLQVDTPMALGPRTLKERQEMCVTKNPSNSSVYRQDKISSFFQYGYGAAYDTGAPPQRKFSPLLLVHSYFACLNPNSCQFIPGKQRWDDNGSGAPPRGLVSFHSFHVVPEKERLDFLEFA